MRGFYRFLGKEITELSRTWRLPVLGGVALFFALSGPILALLTPQLLESMQSSQPGVIIQVPDPVFRDAYAQWIKNLSQLVAFVAIIAAAGSISGEVAGGTTTLVLTKPVSRAAFVVSKAVALIGLVHVAVVAGTVVTQLVTLAVFGEAPPGLLWGPVVVWLLFAAFLIAAAVLLSAILPTLAAAGVGVGVFFAISLAALWGPLVEYSPAGLTLAPSELLLGKEPALVWPIVTTLAATVALIALAAWLFGRREI